MLIYYFTRTQRSRKIAEEMARKHSTTPRPITDGKNWSGAFGYIRAGAMASFKKSLPATYEKPPAGEPVTVVFPLWAGGFPPAVRTFVDEVGRARITAVPTSLGSTLADREGFAQVIDLVGQEIVAP